MNPSDPQNESRKKIDLAMVAACVGVAVAAGVMIWSISKNSSSGSSSGSGSSGTSGTSSLSAGIDFSKVTSQPTKTYGTPFPVSTWEAVVNVPDDKDDTKRTGVIFGNYKEATGNVSNIEIHLAGRPRLYIVNQDKSRTLDVMWDYNVKGKGDVYLTFVRDCENKTVKCYAQGQELKLYTPPVFGGIATVATSLALATDASLYQPLTPITSEDRMHYIGTDRRSDWKSVLFKGVIKRVAISPQVYAANQVQTTLQKAELPADFIVADLS